MTTPPIIGVAIRFMTSAPAWVTGDHMIGISPKRIAHTVMIFGPERCTAPSLLPRADRPSLHAPCGAELFPRVIEIEQHHDAGLGIEAGERDQTDPDCDAHIVAEQVEKPEGADNENGTASRTMMVFTTDRVLK